MSNLVAFAGRLAADPVVFTNKDNSRKVRFVVVTDRGYNDKQGNRVTDAIEFETFIPASVEGNGAFGFLGRGDLVSLTGSLRRDAWAGADGKMNYRQYVDVRLGAIQALETKAATAARRERQAQAPAAQPAQPVAQAQPVMQPQVAQAPAPQMQYAAPAQAYAQPVAY